MFDVLGGKNLKTFSVVAKLFILFVLGSNYDHQVDCIQHKRMTVGPLFVATRVSDTRGESWFLTACDLQVACTKSSMPWRRLDMQAPVWEFWQTMEFCWQQRDATSTSFLMKSFFLKKFINSMSKWALRGESLKISRAHINGIACWDDYSTWPSGIE